MSFLELGPKIMHVGQDVSPAPRLSISEMPFY